MLWTERGVEQGRTKLIAMGGIWKGLSEEGAFESSFEVHDINIVQYKQSEGNFQEEEMSWSKGWKQQG